MGKYKIFLLFLLVILIQHIKSINIHLDQNLCSYKFDNYSIQWAYEPYSKNVVFVLKHKIDKNSFLTGIGFGDHKKDFVDFIGVFLKNGQIGIADTFITSIDGKLMPDALTNVQSIAFDYSNNILTAKFARTLNNIDKDHDQPLDECQIFNFPIKGGLISRSNIVLDFDEIIEKKICNINKNCIVDIKNNKNSTSKKELDSKSSETESESSKIQSNTKSSEKKSESSKTKADSKSAEDESESSKTKIDSKSSKTESDPESTKNETDSKSSELITENLSSKIIKDTKPEIAQSVDISGTGDPCSFSGVNYTVNWTYNPETEDVEFIMRHPIKQGKWWSAVGIGDTMADMDIAIMFISSGRPKRIRDYFSSSYGVPKEDEKNDWILSRQKTKSIDGIIELGFSRKLETGNNDDDRSLDGCVLFQFAANGGRYGSGFSIHKHDDWPDLYKACDIKNKCKPKDTNKRQEPMISENNDNEEMSIDEDDEIDHKKKKNKKQRKMRTTTTTTIASEVDEITTTSSSILGKFFGMNQADVVESSSTVIPDSEGNDEAFTTTIENEANSSEDSKDEGFETTLSMSFSPLSGDSEVSLSSDSLESTVASAIDGGSSVSVGTSTISWTMDPDFSPIINGELNTSRNNQISANDLRTAPASSEEFVTTTLNPLEESTVINDDNANPTDDQSTTPLTLTTILSGGDSTSVENVESSVTASEINGGDVTIPTLATILSGGDSIEATSESTVLDANQGNTNDIISFTFENKNNNNIETTTVNSEDTSSLSSDSGSTETSGVPVDSTATSDATQNLNEGSGVSETSTEIPGVTGVVNQAIGFVDGSTLAPESQTAESGAVSGETTNSLTSDLVTSTLADVNGDTETSTGIENSAAITVTTSPGLEVFGASESTQGISNDGESTQTTLSIIGFGESSTISGIDESGSTITGEVVNSIESTTIVPTISGEATTIAPIGLETSEVSAETTNPEAIDGSTGLLGGEPTTISAVAVENAEEASTSSDSSEVTTTTSGGLFGMLFGSGTTATNVEAVTENNLVQTSESASEFDLTTVVPGDVSTPPTDVNQVAETGATTMINNGVSEVTSVPEVNPEAGLSGVTSDEMATVPPGVIIGGISSETPIRGEGIVGDVTTVNPVADETTVSSTLIGETTNPVIDMNTASEGITVASIGEETTAMPSTEISMESTTASGFWSGLLGQASGESSTPSSDMATSSSESSESLNAHDVASTESVDGLSPLGNVVSASTPADTTSEVESTDSSSSSETIQTSTGFSGIVTEIETSSESTENLEGSGEESTEITSLNTDGSTTPVPGPFNSQSIVNTLGEEAIGNPSEGCGNKHEDFSLCNGYFNEYLEKVKNWAENNSEEMSDQYPKACTLLKRVDNVPKLCCKIYYETCNGHIDL